MAGNTPYGLSKGGVRMLTRSAGVELGEHGITVVGVAPGAVATPINVPEMSDPETMSRSSRWVPRSCSRPGSSSSSRSVDRAAGSGIRSRSPARRRRAGCASRSRRWAITRATCTTTSRPGRPRRRRGRSGPFDYRGGGHDQIWIAGGIGVTPFLSWIRALDGTFDRSVEFFYSVAHEAEALYLDEIEPATRSTRRHRHGARRVPDRREGHGRPGRWRTRLGLHVRPACDDELPRGRLPRSRDPGHPGALGAVRRALT